MAKIQAVKRLVKEDFPDQTSWIEKLLQPLNSFMESTSAAINGSLTITDNLDAKIVTVEAKIGASGLIHPIYVPIKLQGQPRGLLVTQVSGPSNPTAAVAAVWSYDSSKRVIGITSFFGLQPAASVDTYSITLLIHAS